MATVPSPITFVAGNKLTAAQMNTNVRDAGNFFVSPPMAKVRNSGAFSIPNGVFTAMTWDTEDVDSDNMHSTSTNTSRLVAVTPGWYLVTANVEMAANATGARFIRLLVDGVTVIGATGGGPVLGGANFNASVSGFVFLAATHYVEVQAYQASGGALSTSGVNGSNDFSAVWVHS